MKRVAYLGLCGLILLSCSRTKLEALPPEPPPGRDDKITVSGEFCTRTPDQLAFPLRVLFVVDTSDSMEVTDPPDEETGESSRVTAVRGTWSRLLEESDFVKVGIVKFSANAKSETVELDDNQIPKTYFTRDAQRLEDGTSALEATERTTNFLVALDEAYSEIRTEMLRMDEGQLGRSKFVVIFLSDGLPDRGGGGARNQAGSILESIRRMRDLKSVFSIKEIQFHTAYLSSDAGAFAAEDAQNLLKRMADVGGGTFRSFASGERLDFLHIDLSSIKRLFTLESLVAFNTHMVRDKEQIPSVHIPWFDDQGSKDVNESESIDCVDPLIDSDGDGLADMVELRIGTDPLLPDTDGDGLRDRVEWGLISSGLDPLDGDDSSCFTPEAVADFRFRYKEANETECPTQVVEDCCISDKDCCTDADDDGYCDCPLNAEGECEFPPPPDSDGDGLNDCEEIFIGTSKTKVDTDSDGLPDWVEYRYRTDTVGQDAIGDLDWDRTPNGVELRSGGNALCDDADVRSDVAYDYVLREDGVRDNRSCYSFRIGGITLLPTRENGDGAVGNGLNRILFFAGERSFDEPETFAGWRIACVEGTYKLEGDRKTPLSGRMELTDEDFIAADKFDPSACKQP